VFAGDTDVVDALLADGTALHWEPGASFHAARTATW
jgi:hypothetical protein